MKIQKRTTHQTDIIAEVIALLNSKIEPGTPVTGEMWNVAYEIVWARAALEMIEWKEENLSPTVRAEHDYGC